MKIKKYQAYNEITKEYDVEVVTMDEYKQIAKNKPNTKILICTEKAKIESKTSFQDEVRVFIQEQREFNKKIMDRIDNLVKKNNLKE